MADTMGSRLELNFGSLVEEPEKAAVFVVTVVFVFLDVAFFLWLIYAMIRNRSALYHHAWGPGDGSDREKAREPPVDYV